MDGGIVILEETTPQILCFFEAVFVCSNKIYTDQKYKCNTFSKSKLISMYTIGIFLSNSVHKFVAKIIHPPDRCGISGCWLNGVISTQVCLGMVTNLEY